LVAVSARRDGQQLSPATRQKLTASLDKAAAVHHLAAAPGWRLRRERGRQPPSLPLPCSVTRQARPGAGDDLERARYLRGLSKPDGGIYNKIVPHYVTRWRSAPSAGRGRQADSPMDKARQFLAETSSTRAEGT